MFQSPLDTGDRADRNRRIKVLAVTLGIFAVLSGIVVYMILRQPRQAPVPGQRAAVLMNAYRAGSPEFEEYHRFVTVEDQDATEATNLLGQKQVVTRGFLTNHGERTLTGVEVRAILYDLDNKPVAERVAVPIPKQRARLGPNETMPIQVNVDTVPPRAAIARFEIVVQGLKFE